MAVIDWLLLQAAAAAVQAPPALAPVPALQTPRPDGGAPTAAAGSASLAPGAPSVAPVVARDPGIAAPPPLQDAPPTFQRRPALQCADFRPAPGAGWTAAATVQFPGPRGPVQVLAGQLVSPGDYLDGLDLGSILQRDCPRTALPPTG
jgi:hypothetical protein